MCKGYWGALGEKTGTKEKRSDGATERRREIKVDGGRQVEDSPGVGMPTLTNTSRVSSLIGPELLAWQQDGSIDQKKDIYFSTIFGRNVFECALISFLTSPGA